MLETLFAALQKLTGMNWHQVVFTQPDIALWGLFFLLLLWGLYLWRPAQTDLEQEASSQFVTFRHPFIHLFLLTATQKTEHTQPNPSKLWKLLQILRLLILIFALLALAQPEWKKPSLPETSTTKVREIQLVIESSVTFVLPDYELNGQPLQRMQVVKSVLSEFIQQLSGNRFGISIFAEQAYTLLPMTDDIQVAQLSLQRLKPFLAGRTDEGMGEALGLALQQIDQKGTPRHRIIILISDGLTQPSKISLSSVVTYAQAMKVPIYTIGIGAGHAQADKRQYEGLTYSPLDPRILKALSEQTQGHYYQVGSGQDLQKVLNLIQASTGQTVTLPPPPPQQLPLYFWPLKVAVLLLLLYGLLRLKLKKVTS